MRLEVVTCVSSSALDTGIDNVGAVPVGCMDNV